MFNYNKEVIVNDLDNVIVSGDICTVKRGGEYKLKNIVGGKIFKTRGNKGVCAKATIQPKTFHDGADYHQILIFIKTTSKELADYGLANWHEFGKPIIVETASKDAKGIVEAINLARPYDNPIFTASKTGDKVKIDLAEPWMDFAEIRVFAHEPKPWDPNFMFEIKDPDLVSIKHNVEEFATAKWLVENLRFPSYPNVRYTRLYSDESPVAGTVYTEYAFEYYTERPVPGGLSAVGQKVDSITGHVFFIPTDKEDDFQAKFAEVEGLIFSERASKPESLKDDENKTVVEITPTEE